MRTTALTLLMLLSLPLLAAGKITTDPNVRPAAGVTQQKTAEDALRQKVTVDFSGKRLHALIEELSKQSGVSIRCGINSKDWGVRDLPVVVYAKDFPLGKLLRAIADATHLALKAETTDDGVSYRIYRDGPQRRALEDYLKAIDKAALDKVSWQWDTLVALAALPESEVNACRARYLADLDSGCDMLRAYGKLLTALGSDAKRRLLSGEKIVVSSADSSQTAAETILDIGKRSQGSDWRFGPRDRGDVTAAWVILSLGNSPPAKLTVERFWKEKTVVGQSNFNLPGAIEAVSKSLKDWPAAPKPPDPPAYDFSAMAPIKDYPEALKQKIELTRPEKDTMIWSEAIKIIGRASGYAMVCEDFLSYNQLYTGFLPGYGKDVPLKPALENLEKYARLALRMDPKNKLIVGSAEEWWERHTSMVPESLLVSLKQKLDGPGMELDDALPIYRLTEGQRKDWIYNAPELVTLDFPTWKTLDPLWTFYDSLGPEDRKLAKSDMGLPLAKFDPQQIARVFAASEAVRSTDMASLMAAQEPPPDTVTGHLPKDPDVISKLVFRLTSESRRTFRVRSTGVTSRISVSTYSNQGIDRKTYFPTISGDNINFKGPGINLSFPTYSLEREYEIVKGTKPDSK